MSIGSVFAALGIFVVFGGLSLWMGRVAWRDSREGLAGRDGLLILSAVQSWWPTLIAAAVAIAGPVVVLMSS
jgi:hypothetical protein